MKKAGVIAVLVFLMSVSLASFANAQSCVDSSDCDDFDACTGEEFCIDGTCVQGTSLDCDDSDLCTEDSCDPQSGCINSPVSCDDSNACTDDSCDSQTGCVFDPITCDDQNPCTEDSCSVSLGCQFQIDDANTCEDGLFCNGQEFCSEGNCLDGEDPCIDDAVQCTDLCDEDTDTCNAPNDQNCLDGAGCNGAEFCDPETGCQSGTPPVCDDGNVCTDDFCNNEGDGFFCSTEDNFDSCDDEDACTPESFCFEGGCVGEGFIQCGDEDPCTEDSCNSQTGCQNPLVAGCCDENSDCGDGNPCTKDECEIIEGPPGNCKHTPGPCGGSGGGGGGSSCRTEIDYNPLIHKQLDFACKRADACDVYARNNKLDPNKVLCARIPPKLQTGNVRGSCGECVELLTEQMPTLAPTQTPGKLFGAQLPHDKTPTPTTQTQNQEQPRTGFENPTPPAPEQSNAWMFIVPILFAMGIVIFFIG